MAVVLLSSFLMEEWLSNYKRIIQATDLHKNKREICGGSGKKKKNTNPSPTIVGLKFDVYPNKSCYNV